MNIRALPPIPEWKKTSICLTIIKYAKHIRGISFEGFGPPSVSQMYEGVEFLEIPLQHYRDIESGSEKLPLYAAMHALAKFFDVDVLARCVSGAVFVAPDGEIHFEWRNKNEQLHIPR